MSRRIPDPDIVSRMYAIAAGLTHAAGGPAR